MGNIHVTNADFLAAIRAPSDECGYIPHDAIQWVCHYPGEPSSYSWAGSTYTPPQEVEYINENTFFNISLLTAIEGQVSRRISNFMALQCVVLDDVCTKAKEPLLLPSWILETSPGNYQWGYILDQPISEIDEANALWGAIIRAGYSDPGAKTPATRYMRLPVGSNAKPEHAAKNGGKPFLHRLHSWEPKKLFSIIDLVDGLGLQLIPSALSESYAQHSQERRQNHIVTDSDAALIRAILEHTKYHDSLLQLSARYAARGIREADIIQILSGLMLANGDSTDRWKERFDDIPRIVKSGIKKFHDDSIENDISFVDFSSLAVRQPPPREWLVDQWIPRGCVTVLFGRGGIGKSLLAQQLAFSVAFGTKFLGLDTKQGDVFGLFCEDDENELLRRGQKILSRHNISSWSICDNLKIDARAGKPNLLARFGIDRQMHMEALWNHLCLECAKIKPALIILDNIAQLYGGLESDRTQVTSFCNKLTWLAREYNCAILLLGHPAKGELSEYSGSTAWEAAVRTRLFLKPSTEGSLMVSKSKSNYSLLEDMRIQYHDGIFLRTDNVIEIPHLLSQACEQILTALKMFGKRQINCSNYRTTASYVIKMMQRENLLLNIPTSIAEQALNKLIDEKMLIPNAIMPWKGSNRRSVVGLGINPELEEDVFE